MGIVQYAFDHHRFSTKKRAARAMASPQIAGKCLALQSICVIEASRVLTSVEWRRVQAEVSTEVA
jgi:hypothetical protein